jgi:phage shock protein PspC (stress-responsive transcriptional regulator)
MQDYKHAVLARPDTMFGVCQALGEDFGFNPLFLRVAFGVPLLWSPTVVIAVYALVGLIVAVSRFLYPNPRPTQVTAAEAKCGVKAYGSAEAVPGVRADQENREEFAIAA